MQHVRILRSIGMIALGAVILTACGTSAQPEATQPPGGGGSGVSLENTTWNLTEIDSVAVPAEVGANITFADGKVSGSGGCNGYGGGYAINGSTITFSEIVSTLMACEDAKMNAETSFMSVLQGDAAFTLSATSLIITGANGTVLTFTPQ